MSFQPLYQKPEGCENNKNKAAITLQKKEKYQQKLTSIQGEYESEV